ncbi:MAG: ATP-binding protein [Bacteroidia bacterium]
MNQDKLKKAGEIKEKFSNINYNNSKNKKTLENAITRSLIKYSVDGIFTFNKEKVITSWNPTLEVLTGIDKMEVLGKPVHEIFPMLNKKYDENIFTQVLNGERLVIPENRYPNRNGYFEAQMMPLMNEENSVMGGLALIYDITDRKMAEEYIKKKNLMLEQSNEELRQFAYIVSHDLKAPLRAISNMASWIQKDYANALDNDGRELLEMIINRSVRMDDFINAILDYSKVGRLKHDVCEVRINDLVTEVLENLQPPASIKVEVQPDLPVLAFERVKLYQVFQNLIGNAIKFNDKANGAISVFCKEDGKHWIIGIKDNGIGIEKKYHKKIFQLFQTLSFRDETQDTGVGLAVVKKIVESNFGTIWLESEKGIGSTFYFSIPKKQSAAAALNLI